MSRKTFGRTLAIGCTAAALTLISACSGQTATVDSGSGDDSGDSKTISITVTPGYDEGVAATYLWKELLTERGYTVEVQELDIASSYTGVANKQVDLYLDAWLPTTHEPYWKRLGSKMEKVSAWYSPADLNVTVPKYVTDVNTIDDLKKHASEFDNKIVGIEAGSGLMRTTRTTTMPKYGLDDFRLTESSTSAMLSELKSAIAAKKPVAVTLWRPHWAYTKMPLKPLKDPKGAYGKPDRIEAVATKGFSKEHPELAQWLGKFKLTSDQLGTLELMLQKKGQGQEQAAAKEWIAKNESVVDSWFK
ncbi:glycine betaine ABC transporter substrate-binding protein [Streptomyces cavernicola]|uniref:Glycine betaine ABC transporter substrate-binding protein n=1 Tax=Streptomyces cavernicola TaxID=3043613 RepID=A0ABT6SE16_9ACTN|nr:glycine betaine ABC transporter substrate-binding protein [Streptomyces sp. B-S-A6]MDI3406405.1 glycine betaine ABC transporter substrate-binding protein [Streptomyces sp. B-S-A6]